MSDPTPQIDVTRHRQRRMVILGVIGVTLVLVVLFGAGNVPGVLDGGGIKTAVFWAIVLGGVFVIFGVIGPLLNGERRRLARRVQEARPGSVVIAGHASSDTKTDAPKGVSRRGIRSGSGPLVIALLPQTIEVWSRGDAAPRWTIDRTKAEVTVGYQGEGTSAALGIFISDGARAVRFMPADDSVSIFDQFGRVESALRALGEDPERHFKRD